MDIRFSDLFNWLYDQILYLLELIHKIPFYLKIKQINLYTKILVLTLFIDFLKFTSEGLISLVFSVQDIYLRTFI